MAIALLLVTGLSSATPSSAGEVADPPVTPITSGWAGQRMESIASAAEPPDSSFDAAAVGPRHDPTEWCLGDDYDADPAGDPGPDLLLYGVLEVCNFADPNVYAHVRTRSRHDFAEVLIDNDLDLETGCAGVDWAYVKIGATVRSLHLTSCEPDDWTEVGSVPIRTNYGTYSIFPMDGALVRGSRWTFGVGNWDGSGYDSSWTTYYASTLTVPCSSHLSTIPEARDGYWLAGVDGSTWAFGSAPDHGHNCRSALGTRRVTDFEQIDYQSGPDNRQGWVMLHADGSLFTGLGEIIGRVYEPWNMNATTAVAVMPVVDRQVIPNGLWVAYDNGVVVWTHVWVLVPDNGDPPAGIGDIRHLQLSSPVIDAVAVGDGNGYWLVSSDGGVFALGSATFHGSMGATPLNAPVVAMVADPDGVGYWLVAADGGVFAFDAPYRGSVPEVLPSGRTLNSPIVGMTAYGDGYLMFAADGGVFNFSDRSFVGSLGDSPPVAPIAGVAVLPQP